MLISYISTNVAILNTLLSAGIPIPSVAGVNISDVDLENFDGYVKLGLTPTVSFWESVTFGMKLFAEH
jgi:hypothetical protein